jgi:thymidylate synthase
MNKLDKQYTDLLKDILENGTKKTDRTGTGTISVFGRQIRHNMKDGFPLLTTKKMPFKTIVTELLWFLRGDTNIKYLVDNNCHIWDGDAYKNYLNNCTENYKNHNKNVVETDIPDHWKDSVKLDLSELLSEEEFINKIKTDDKFAKKWGDLGPIYGKQWRKWEQYSKGVVIGPEYYKDDSIDQIQNLIDDLKTNPDSRRLMVNAWNVGELDSMVLPPCHYGFQVYTRELSNYERVDIQMNKNDYQSYYSKEDLDGNNIPTRAISLMWNQRSVDTFLGLPFNIASYGLLLEIIAKEVNMVPEELIGNLGDVHLYSNHIEQAKEQIGRELDIIERVDYGVDVLGYHGLMDYGHSQNEDEIIIKFCDEYGVPKCTREPFPLPTIKVSGSWKFLSSSPCFGDTIQHKDIELENYQSHPTIKAPLSN